MTHTTAKVALPNRDVTLSLFNFEQSFETKFYFVFLKTVEMTSGHLRNLLKPQKTKIRKNKVNKVKLCHLSNKVLFDKVYFVYFVFPQNHRKWPLDTWKTLKTLKNENSEKQSKQSLTLSFVKQSTFWQSLLCLNFFVEFQHISSRGSRKSYFVMLCQYFVWDKVSKKI